MSKQSSAERKVIKTISGHKSIPCLSVTATLMVKT
jgi:hypothetical protein